MVYLVNCISYFDFLLPSCTESPIQKKSLHLKKKNLPNSYLFQIVFFLGVLKVKTWPQDHKTFFMLNSAEHEICPANKSQIANNCKLFLAKHS